MAKPTKKPIVIVVIGRKGGVGKTTISHHLSKGLCLTGRDVEQGEGDDQPRLRAILEGILSRGEEPDASQTTYGLFMQPELGVNNEMIHVINVDELWRDIPHINVKYIEQSRQERGFGMPGNYYFLPGSERIGDLDRQLALKAAQIAERGGTFQINDQLRMAMQSEIGVNRILVFDTLPSLSNVWKNIARIATHMLIVADCDFASPEEYSRTLGAYRAIYGELQNEGRTPPELLGVVINKFIAGNPDHQEVMEQYTKSHEVRYRDAATGQILTRTEKPLLGNVPLLGVIPEDLELINRAAKNHRTLEQWAPYSEAGKAMWEFINNTMSRLPL